MLDEALKREVVVMGAGRKVELGRRMGLLDVLREVEEGVIVSASREPVMELGSDGRGVWGAERIVTDLVDAARVGDVVEVRRVAILLAVEAVRIGGEIGKRG